MSNLLEKISQDLKQAMIKKETDKLSVLRMLVAALHNKEISLRPASSAKPVKPGGQAKLNDEQIIEVVSSEIKKRQDSILAYEQGRRQDLVDKETGELKILEKYLPAQLSDQEVEGVIRKIIASGVKDFGRVMGQTMAKVKGKATGNRVSELVKKVLT